MDNVFEITRHIKRLLLEMGLTHVGIAKAESFGDKHNRYEQWLQAGRHAGMNYMVRQSEKRNNIDLVLPGIQSVIVVGLNYYTPFAHSNEAGLGKISRYAWGSDYHDVLGSALENAVNDLQAQFPDYVWKKYVDSGPVSEKQWAVKAGVGWQGKHSNIISRSHGSWFFLGEILTTMPLSYDSPMQDFCGNCTACLEACPTKAIVEPYVVDSNLCLSYWTIETKPEQEFPPHISNNLDNWLFGCDVCQDVCPWNRFQQATTEELFFPRNEETELPLDFVAALTQEEFSERFRKSPVKRTKKNGLQRNANVAAEQNASPKK